MKNPKLFQKIVFIGIIVLILLSLVAPVIFSQALPAPKQEKLLNGLKVLMWQDNKADKVWVKVRVHSGSAFDPQGKEGVMQMLADNLFPNEAAREFFVEDLGGSLEVEANYDFIQINASAKPEEFLAMLEAVASAVSNPQIDKETTVKLRTAMLEKLKAMEADPVYVADTTIARRLFGAFPYGRPRHGTSATVQKLDFADLVDARQRFLSADNATVIIAGNFDRTLGFRAARRYFGAWLKSDKLVPATFRQPDDPPPGILTVASPKPEVAALRFAFRGAARADKDLAASKVFSTILETRLKNRVPSAHTADVSVWNEAHTLPGSITIRFASAKDMAGTANGKVDGGELVGKALTDPVTEAEFAVAKAAVQAAWAKKDPYSFWLDADTFNLANLSADIRAAENVTFADVTSYAQRIQKLPSAAVLVNTPTEKN